MPPDLKAPAGRKPRFRLGDFEWRAGRVVLTKTGNSAAFDRRLLAEVATWAGFYLAVRFLALRHAFVRRPRPEIWFTPNVPHPRYMVRIAAIRAGIGLARSAATADAVFFFDDATVSTPLPPRHARAFNFGCGDISKSRVATVFAAVFGYPLAVDPASWTSPAVEKSEANGRHDGRIVQCPCPPRAGRVYQRVIDNLGDDGFAYDLRTSVVDAAVVAVWVKRRAAAGRFLPPNLSAARADPATVFTPVEHAQIAAFVRAMGADWCGLDILRDRGDGRIYVVDVNKTDAGPIIALPFAAKLASVAVLAAALQRMVGKGAD